MDTRAERDVDERAMTGMTNREPAGRPGLVGKCLLDGRKAARNLSPLFGCVLCDSSRSSGVFCFILDDGTDLDIYIFCTPMLFSPGVRSLLGSASRSIVDSNSSSVATS